MSLRKTSISSVDSGLDKKTKMKSKPIEKPGHYLGVKKINQKLLQGASLSTKTQFLKKGLINSESKVQQILKKSGDMIKEVNSESDGSEEMFPASQFDPMACSTLKSPIVKVKKEISEYEDSSDATVEVEPTTVGHQYNSYNSKINIIDVKVIPSEIKNNNKTRNDLIKKEIANASESSEDLEDDSNVLAYLTQTVQQVERNKESCNSDSLGSDDEGVAQTIPNTLGRLTTTKNSNLKAQNSYGSKQAQSEITDSSENENEPKTKKVKISRSDSSSSEESKHGNNVKQRSTKNSDNPISSKSRSSKKPDLSHLQVSNSSESEIDAYENPKMTISKHDPSSSEDSIDSNLLSISRSLATINSDTLRASKKHFSSNDLDHRNNLSQKISRVRSEKDREFNSLNKQKDSSRSEDENFSQTIPSKLSRIKTQKSKSEITHNHPTSSPDESDQANWNVSNKSRNLLPAKNQQLKAKYTDRGKNQISKVNSIPNKNQTVSSSYESSDDEEKHTRNSTDLNHRQPLKAMPEKVSKQPHSDSGDSSEEQSGFHFEAKENRKNNTHANLLEKFIHENSTYTKQSIPKEADLSNLGNDEDVYLVQIPKSVNPKLLRDVFLSLTDKTKVKIEKTRYVVRPCSEIPRPIYIASNGIHKLEPVATLRMERNVKKTNQPELIVPEKTRSALPDNIKVRHPLFGMHYKSKIKLDKNVEEKLDAAATAIDQKRKKKKKIKKKTDESALEQEKHELIFEMLEQRFKTAEPITDEITPITKKKKKKVKEEIKIEIKDEPVGFDENNFGETKKKKRKKEKLEANEDNVKIKTEMEDVFDGIDEKKWIVEENASIKKKKKKKVKEEIEIEIKDEPVKIDENNVGETKKKKRKKEKLEANEGNVKITTEMEDFIGGIVEQSTVMFNVGASPCFNTDISSIQLDSTPGVKKKSRKKSMPVEEKSTIDSDSLISSLLSNVKNKLNLDEQKKHKKKRKHSTNDKY